MSDPQQTAAAPAPAPNDEQRPSAAALMTLIVIVIMIAAVAYGLYYFLVARFHESTDDAYVNGNVVQITPQVIGTVICGERRRHADGQGRRPARRARSGRLARSRSIRPKRISRRRCARSATLFVERQPVRSASRAAQVGSVARAGRPAPPHDDRANGRRVAGRNLARARRRAQRAGRARLRPAGTRVEPRAHVEHDDREPPERARRRRESPRFVYQLRAQHAAGAGHGLRREALGAGRPARVAGQSADGDRAAERRVGRRQLQGSATEAHAHRPAGRTDGRPVRFERRVPRQGDRLLGRHRLGVLAAAGAKRHRQLDQGRAASARARSRSTRRNWKSIRCASACR